MAAPAKRSRLDLFEPSLKRLPAYAEALARGWSPNNVDDVSAAQLAAIRANAGEFLASILGSEGTITLPDGSKVPKLPSRVRWMWDGDFLGQIALRWQPGTDALPQHVLGHVGYAVVPWKRRLGYATEALRLMLGEARTVGLSSVEITTDRGNTASCRVIEANGGLFVEEFIDRRHGEEVRLRYRINVSSAAGGGSSGQGA